MTSINSNKHISSLQSQKTSGSHYDAAIWRMNAITEEQQLAFPDKQFPLEAIVCLCLYLQTCVCVFVCVWFCRLFLFLNLLMSDHWEDHSNHYTGLGQSFISCGGFVTIHTLNMVLFVPYCGHDLICIIIKWLTTF